MNLKEMLITEEKMNNYIENMNNVRGNESAIKEFLADRKTYVEYLRYIGVSQELYENPAVIINGNNKFPVYYAHNSLMISLVLLYLNIALG